MFNDFKTIFIYFQQDIDACVDIVGVIRFYIPQAILLSTFALALVQIALCKSPSPNHTETEYFKPRKRTDKPYTIYFYNLIHACGTP